jgi:hypothetical protein
MVGVLARGMMGFRCRVSAPLPAEDTAGIIEKETLAT